jgi:uncharacterized protein (TIGR00369 family)
MIDNISFPRAETCMIMEPYMSNIMGNVHGGELMKIMDSIAGIAAMKQAKDAVVTARVDELIFHKPIHVGNVVTCIGQVAYVGRSSIQVMVKVLVHDINDYEKTEIALSAFFTMVRLVDGKPAKVPPLTAKTKEEEELYRLGEEKYLDIKKRLRKKKE